MASYKLSSKAQSDLIEIRRYTLQRWGEAQWLNYFTELKLALEMLSQNPQLGIESSELGQHYYRFPLKHHVIYYKNESDYIAVAAVLGKSMAPAAHLQGNQ